VIPKRAIAALLTTVMGLVLLFSFKTPESPALAATTGSRVAIEGQPPATTTPDSGSGQSSTGATSGGTTSGGTTSGGTTSGGTTSGGTTSGGTTSGAYADGTFTGSLISTRYGDVQVQVTTAGGAISDVTALALPDRDGHSVRISQAAEPLLREEALTAQSAQIDLLSGATYTSDAYVQSLQSALDQARA
jgi:uncharacterized protein with FMN-binding domain